MLINKSNYKNYSRGITMKVNAYLEIIMKISSNNRQAAGKVYADYRDPFLETIEGALTKDLLIRDEDV